MRTAEINLHCPTCEQAMGIADVSLGEIPPRLWSLLFQMPRDVQLRFLSVVLQQRDEEVVRYTAEAEHTSRATACQAHVHRR